MSKIYISKEDQYLFGKGLHYQIYEKLGAHPSEEKGKEGYYFAVWAPNAQEVHVVGDFSGWDEQGWPMSKLGPGGIWGLFIPGIKSGALYKYLIVTSEGEKIYKADPYACYAELRPGTASRTFDLDTYKWGDSKWMSDRETRNIQNSPVAIYECHIGSWMKHPDGTEDGFYTYRQFADRLVEYLKGMKFTHVELMGIAEHPFDGSWGYQVTGYYAPTSRYGDPHGFMYLVDRLHKAGVGVILDWVPAHFCPDAHGLARFDGSCLYENADPRKGEHPDWGTKIFDLGRCEVSNFLIANALYWAEKFHVDGLRVDAVASMLYLDYGKKDGQWVRNKFGTNKNLEAIEFFKHLNSIIHQEIPSFMMIAEESTAWPKITASPDDDGLGFTFKWNMGWMHDFCEYMKLDPYFRKGDHNGMTFAMSYNGAEKYILPLSHDEVVHLKCSMLGKMPGYPKDKYANLRCGYAFMFGHSGKKLLFMGQEFAQEREWSEKRELDWFLLQNKENAGMEEFMKELLKIYNKYPALWSVDDGWDGFEWLNADDADRSVYSFYRKDYTGKKRVLFVINFSPMWWKDYWVPFPEKCKVKLILNSDDTRFGGDGNKIPGIITPTAGDCIGRPYHLVFDLPPYTAAVFTF